MRVLVVDDERAARRVLVDLVALVDDVEVHEASSAGEAKALIESTPFDALLVDICLPADPDNRDGLWLVAEAGARSILSVVVSRSLDLAAVRSAMRMGAHDYVLRDELSEDLIVPMLRSIQSKRSLEREAAAPALPWLVGSSHAIQELRRIVQRVAMSDRPVLVTGPTGSGKELVVRAVHALGRHPDAPLLDLNCGAFPETLVESQLFGHERGAFTGADKKHDGFFAVAELGTVFLDELAEMSVLLQAKLLRALETSTFRPIGASVSRRFKGRVVAATCADLPQRVAEGRFREDLYYRLNVLEIRVPALEDRREDIPLLVQHFARNQSRPLVFSGEAMRRAQEMPWPGNARQLRNLVDRLVVFAPEGPITADVLEQFAAPPAARNGDPIEQLAREVLKSHAPDKLRAVEDALVREALRVARGNKRAAARLLGVHRKVVERRTADAPDDGTDPV